MMAAEHSNFWARAAARVARASFFLAGGVALLARAYLLDWQQPGAPMETLMAGVCGFALMLVGLVALGSDAHEDDCVTAMPDPAPRGPGPAPSFARYRDVLRPPREQRRFRASPASSDRRS